MPEYKIGDRNFRNRESYEAGLRDQRRIRIIEERAREADLEGKKELLRKMEQEQYRFETILGSDYLEKFRDMVYRLELEEIEAKPQKRKEKREKKRVEKTETVAKTRQNEKKQKQTRRKKPEKKKDLKDYDPQMQKIILEEMVKQEKKRKKITVFSFLIAFVFLTAFGISMYIEIKNGNLTRQNIATKEKKETYIKYEADEHKDATGSDSEATILPEYQGLYNANQNLIGWIKIEGTKIDYPVMCTDDREYYLTHDFEETYDKNGTIFMDPDCVIDQKTRSTNVILYGHNMKSGKMFGTLRKYKDYDYYTEHRYIQFDTIYETGKYEVMYAFRSKVYYEDEITFKYYQFIDAVSEEAFRSNLEAMAEMSYYDTGVTAFYGDELLTLSTCDNSEKNGRFVVVARRID